MIKIFLIVHLLNFLRLYKRGGWIRAMEKWFKVFVSSTSEDLQVERDKVMRLLLKINCIPAGMENFPSTGEHQWEIIKRNICSSNYYLLILAGRYGSINESGVGGAEYKGLSFTEMEYKYAISKGKPVLPFLYSDIDNLPALKCEKSRYKTQKLKELRKAVEQETEVQYWSNPDELCTLISTSLHHTFLVTPTSGFISPSDLSPMLLLLQEERDRLSLKCQMLQSCIDRQKGEIAQLMKELEELYSSQIKL